MQITFDFNKENIKVENGKLIIIMDSELEKKLSELNKIKLSDVKPGTIIKRNTDTEWIVFRHDEDGSTKLLRKELLDTRMEFDNNTNNFANSKIKRYLNTKYYKEVVLDFEAENILLHSIDLTALNGTYYNSMNMLLVSLLTLDDYRYGVKNGIIPKDLDSLWWLATPWDISSKRIIYVSSDAFVTYSWCDHILCVRPFISVSSDIFVSKVE